MVVRKKPVGEDYEAFREAWETADHEGKLNLAKLYKVTYDTAKHWVSDGPSVPPVRAPVEEGAPSAEEAIAAIGELLATPVGVNLDFVCFDLETTNLKADFGIILCGCIKAFGQEVKVWRGDKYPSWKINMADDRSIVKDLAAELRKHAIVITHYGGGFDIPYLRAKMMYYGLEPLPPMFHIDTYRIAKSNMLLQRRRLETLAEYLSLGPKTHVEGGLWLDAAMNGTKEAMERIVKHCIVDVEVLEKLACITFPYLKSIPKL